ncbi:MAG: chemotaxis protein CheW [Polyangiaceae bacterium]
MKASKQRPDPEKSLVGFMVGTVTYAVPIGCVREIINPVGVTRLPHAPSVVVGVADHRGEVVPIIDLRIRFGVVSSEDTRRVKWILVDVGGMTIGLVVDRVTEVFGTGGTGLRPAPSLGGGEDERGIVGVTAHEGYMVFVLDLAPFESIGAGLKRNNNLEPAMPLLR